MRIRRVHRKWLALTLFFAGPYLAGESAIESAPAKQSTAVKLPGPIKVTKSTRIAPGNYQIRVTPGKAVIEITGDAPQTAVMDELFEMLRAGLGLNWSGQTAAFVFDSIVPIHAPPSRSLTFRSDSIRRAVALPVKQGD
jgi:hypothetical protein